MKLAIISDIHGNLQALESVMKSIENKKVDQVVCLGDIVGYGANPEECVELIRSSGFPTVLGNHDEAATEKGIPEYFNHWALEAILWSRDRLSKNSKTFLHNLPFKMEFGDICLTHASPRKPELWTYLITHGQALPEFQYFSQSVCFIGHSHFPVVFTESEGSRRIINVGSVGQPRDHDPRSCYGIYDDKSLNFEWVRVEYDIKCAASAIVNAGLPKFLANRLMSGT